MVAAGCVRAYMRGADSLWWAGGTELRVRTLLFSFLFAGMPILLASAVKASSVDVTLVFAFRECTSESWQKRAQIGDFC
jgi:hypothetical protein